MRDIGRRSGPAAAPSGAALSSTARFGIPEPPGLHLTRPRLTEVLDSRGEVPLVLVSAPAGTGKTVAVADWARHGRDDATAWITFERGQPEFWSLVLKALDGLGLDVSAVGRPASRETLGGGRLVVLAGLLADAEQRLTLVLDGYELVSRDLADEVDFLLRRGGGHLRLVFVGRVDPVMPLYRYRLTESILELRAPDLAFSDAEAVHLLRSRGVELSSAAVRSLNRRVRGWPVGLRFAARALAHQDSPEEYVATVVEQTGDINEYLLGEVLDAQSPELRRHLLDTSVPDLLCAELVELIGGAPAVHTLRELAGRAAFIELVPEQPDTFAYYPFFRDLLRAQLAFESPERAVEVHRITADWLMSRGAHTEALQHLATIDAWDELVAHLVGAGLVAQLLLDTPDGPLHRLAVGVPVDLMTAEACVVRAAVALGQGSEQRCSEELALARASVLETGAAPFLSMAVAMVDALRAVLDDDAERSAELAAEAEGALRIIAPQCLGPRLLELTTVVDFAAGASALRQGRLDTAALALGGVAARPPGGMSTRLRVESLGYLAVAEAIRGDLSEAVRHADQSLIAAAEGRMLAFDTPPAAHAALACVALERGERDVARTHLSACSASRLLPRDPVCRTLVTGAQVALDDDVGDHLDAAVDELHSGAEVEGARDPWSAERLRVAAARLSLAVGEPDRALASLGASEDPQPLEVAVTAAAAHAEQGVAREEVIEHALADDHAVPLDTRVRALLARAALSSHQRAPVRARLALARSLELAAPERMRRPFRDATPSVRRLLAADPKLRAEHRWLEGGPDGRADAETWAPPAAVARDLPVLVEPLTAKEVEVLGHLAELLTTDEVAAKMFVSVNTVRTHIRSILRKLGVNRRNAAIRRARELRILES